MEDSRSAFYRQYKGGTLVYDSRARSPNESEVVQKLSKNGVTQEELKEIEKCDPFDKYQFTNMFKYPSQKYLPKEYTLVAPIYRTLIFNSKFESGNLGQAVKITEDEYDLYLDFDVETQGYTQWYYFSVKSFKEGHTVKFNILNLMKPRSLYGQGLLPLVLSTMKKEKSGIDWHRDGFNVSYMQNNIPRAFLIQGAQAYYFTLSFTYTFEFQDDLVFFSHCFPYTYTDLLDYLEELEAKTENLNCLKITCLCKTLAGNSCPVLTITENIDTYEEYLKGKCRKHLKKRGIVLTSRVHPGESNSSYIIKGCIDYLLSDSHQARSLRKQFVFKIIPMLNPDGVIYGNYRCSLLGVDLNRRWKDPYRLLHPTVFYAKEMITAFQSFHQLMFYCDIHGHSSKKGIFMYGNKTKSFTLLEQKENIFIRLTPLMLARKIPNFLYSGCSFRIEKFKETTARVVIFREFNVLSCYTLETSFLGPLSPSERYDKEFLTKIGLDLCKVIAFFRTPQKLRQGVESIYKGILPATSKNERFDVVSAIESINPESIAKLFALGDGEGSSSDSAASDNDDRKLNYKMLFPAPKIKVKKKVKKIIPPPVVRPPARTFIKPVMTCAPSSLARTASSQKISTSLNSTMNFRVRKGSYRSLKHLGQTNPINNCYYMELPTIKSRVLSIRTKTIGRDQNVSQSINKFDKHEIKTEIYKLNGNECASKLQTYTRLMKKYMDQFSTKRLIKNTKLEISQRKITRGLSTPSPISSSQYSRYRTAKSPLNY